MTTEYRHPDRLTGYESQQSQDCVRRLRLAYAGLPWHAYTQTSPFGRATNVAVLKLADGKERLMGSGLTWADVIEEALMNAPLAVLDAIGSMPDA